LLKRRRPIFAVLLAWPCNEQVAHQLGLVRSEVVVWGPVLSIWLAHSLLHGVEKPVNLDFPPSNSGLLNMNTLTLSTIRQNLSRYDLAGLGLPVLVLLIMAMLVVPLPPLLLDILFTFNIMISLVVIMIAIGTRKPLEFSSFPSVLLFATMLRLALNVASTRVVLVHGHEGLMRPVK